ncbi:transposase [Methanobrevibacter cuticularis]|uniref:transposase n=1 Tax=Methanobrevibacter cuticularis TaxID=47311 RepID=UPI001FDF1F7F|nr:transposase [Methanobrevibacter cuticularis]
MQIKEKIYLENSTYHIIMFDDEFSIPEEARAMNVFRTIRWPKSEIYCPKCKSTKIHDKGLRYDTRRYQCQEKDCAHNFSDTDGTDFHYSKLTMGEIFYILFNINYKSVKVMSEELERSRSAVNDLVNKFKESFEKNEDLEYDVEEEEDDLTINEVNEIPTAPMGRILKNAGSHRKLK